MGSIPLRFAIMAGLCLAIPLSHGQIRPAAGEELTGRKAPGWDGVEWIRGGPLSLESLRGRVVLVRWWTGPECPHCRASAPTLNAWQRDYSDRGLTIIGFYHHKSNAPLIRSAVEDLVVDLGFRFPVAIDPEWRTLRRWWLDRDREYTSVSFLLDGNGVIRAVHPGGTYGSDEAEAMEGAIRDLLGELEPHQ